MRRIVLAALPIFISAVIFAAYSEGGANTVPNPDDVTCIVNKEFLLSSDYVPKDLVVPNVPSRTFSEMTSMMRKEAARAIEKLYAAAVKEGVIFYNVSGYRPYDMQKRVFDAEVANYGYDVAVKQVALPGTSEHQLGLAMDISTHSMGGGLFESFGDTREGRWLKENSYKFGFIIRYPADKVHVTKYSYEPWHLRYVGEKLAKYLYDNGYTLEEYYALACKYRINPIKIGDTVLQKSSYNIENYNYYKLRDIAKLLKGTASQFDVTWNEKEAAVEIYSETAYKSIARDEDEPEPFNKKAVLSSMNIYFDGERSELKTYLIDGSNYVKLRDLGDLIGFEIRWHQAERLIEILPSY